MEAATRKWHDGATAGTARGRSRRRSEEIAELKARDNATNFIYIAAVYLVLFTTLGVTLWSYAATAEAGYAWWVNIPVTAVAVVIIGAVQHQFGGIIHEGTHYTLFENRLLNELASDWLAAFPIYSSTYAFRLHHFSHHQFVNDPVRDSNFAQAKESGHWTDFPLTHVEFLLATLRQLNPIRLVSYIIARVRYSALGVDTNPYADPDRRGTAWPVRVGILVAVAVPIALNVLSGLSYWKTGAALLILAWAAASLYYWRAPESHFPKNRLDPVISDRVTFFSRISYLTLLYAGITYAQMRTGWQAWNLYTLLWVLPLFTTFPLFMILREWVQHGNADRGRYTNTRVFFVNPLVRFAIFPFGMDYHLPHHLYASVPHYKLKRLHAFLQTDPKYVENARIVEGWAIHGRNKLPTVVDVLGPEYAMTSDEIHVDDTTLENAEVNNMAAIEKHAEASRRGRPTVP